MGAGVYKQGTSEGKMHLILGPERLEIGQWRQVAWGSESRSADVHLATADVGLCIYIF